MHPPRYLPAMRPLMALLILGPPSILPQIGRLALLPQRDQLAILPLRTLLILRLLVQQGALQASPLLILKRALIILLRLLAVTVGQALISVRLAEHLHILTRVTQEGLDTRQTAA